MIKSTAHNIEINCLRSMSVVEMRMTMKAISDQDHHHHPPKSLSQCHSANSKVSATIMVSISNLLWTELSEQVVQPNLGPALENIFSKT